MSAAASDLRTRHLPRAGERTRACDLSREPSADLAKLVDAWLEELYAACESENLRAPSRLVVRHFDDLMSRQERDQFEHLLRRLDVERLNAVGLTAMLCALQPLYNWLRGAPVTSAKLRRRLLAVGRDDILRAVPEPRP